MVDKFELHSSVLKGDLTEVKDLIAAGFDVNYQNHRGWTPLHCLAMNGHPLFGKRKINDLEIVKTLLDAGASVHLKCADGWPPLYWAISKKNEELVNAFIEAGADLNSCNQDWTPIYLSVIWGKLDITRMLINAGANPNVKNKWGWTPLHQVSEAGHIDLVNILLGASVDVNVTDQDLWTPLQKAAQKGHWHIVQTLIGYGADPFFKNRDGKSAFDYADQSTQIAMQYSLDKIAKIEDKLLKQISSSAIRDPLKQFVLPRLSASDKLELHIALIAKNKGMIFSNGSWQQPSLSNSSKP